MMKIDRWSVKLLSLAIVICPAFLVTRHIPNLR